MPELEGNSHKAKKSAEQKVPPTPNKVVVGKVVQRKKPLGRKISEFFTPRDTGTVISHVWNTILLRALKDMAFDAVNGMAGGMIYKNENVPHRGNPRIGGHTQVTPYHLASSNTQQPPREMSRQGRARFDFDEFVLSSRVEADTCLAGLETILDEYGFVRVADLYAMLDVTGTWTDDKWGWFTLAGASVSRIPEGYLLNLPKPVALD